uniref:Uncharacterized protein n=1 Tax=Cannabis sativa TaxID=3483 RepID=A0A803NSA5_CANSA
MMDPFGESDEEMDNGEMDNGSEKNTRGRTTMSELTKLRSEGKTVELEYNVHGQAIGKGGKQYASKLGDIVRSNISINKKSWDDVSAEKKEEIWDEMKSTFDLDYSAKKITIKKADRLCKQEEMLRAIMAQHSTSGSNIGMPSPPYVPDSPYMP